MARASRQSSPSNQLDNYDLTRKTFAIRNIEVLTRLTEEEAAKETPDLAAIADLGIAIATLLGAVG